MAIRLLKASDTASTAEPLDRKILYHLSLDRSFSYICPSKATRELFLSVLTSFTDNIEEIEYRQKIIGDFLQYPELLDGLISLFVRFEDLKKEQKKTKKDSFTINAAGLSSVTSARNILQTRALTLKRALLFVKGFGELLSECDLQSVGLIQFRDACSEIYQNPEYQKLLTHCSRYENFSTTGFLDFKFMLNEEGRIADFGFINHRYIHITDPELKKKGFSFFKKEEESPYPCERVYPLANGFYEKLIVSALSDISGLFAGIAAQIFDRFAPVYEALLFYDAALRYVKKLQEIGVPYCFPKLNRTGNTNVRKLYDLYLLMTTENPTNVVPNDYVLSEKGGMILFGNNGSGKTVYLRSVGTMQLLAQSGLPIPCESAEIAVCSQIATQFSEAEKEFCEGNEAGRFEQEVRELAAMADGLKSGALVFLNETFQSTAYAEGAEGLYHLLQYFTDSGIRWILVSHLRQLEEMFAEEDVEIRHTAEGYQIGV